MTGQQPGAQLPSAGKRHPLLFQQRFSEQVFWPCIVILALSAALLVWNPPEVEPYRVTLRVALAGTGSILVLTMVYRLRAYARCLQSGLHLQLPFFHVLIPYHEIRSTRPTELYRMFPIEQQKWPQRRFLRGIIGKTVVVIEMEQLPHSHIWLRLWMSKYMLSPDRVGLVLAVRDWMAFRAELDEFRARSRHR
jgi:hypothetical protein